MKLIKNIIFYLFIAFIVYAGFSFIFSDKSEGLTAADQQTLDVVRKEQRVKDATITNAGVLYVSVTNDGTVRNGYAMYICNLVKPFNSSVHKIKIVEANTTSSSKRDNAYGVLLGEYVCR